MAMSNFVNDYENYLRESINSGISAETVVSTISDIINSSEKNGKIPKQFGKTLSAISFLKKDVVNKVDYNYTSNFVKNNSYRIKSALAFGITPKEIAITLNNLTNNNSKKQLKFMVKLVSKMKSKELKLNKQMNENKSYQKVLWI